MVINLLLNNMSQTLNINIMKNKELYISPQIEVIQMETEDIIANSPNSPTMDTDGVHGGGTSRSKKFWDDEM